MKTPLRMNFLADDPNPLQYYLKSYLRFFLNKDKHFLRTKFIFFIHCPPVQDIIYLGPEAFTFFVSRKKGAGERKKKKRGEGKGKEGRGGRIVRGRKGKGEMKRRRRKER